jgi:hypothetical protein
MHCTINTCNLCVLTRACSTCHLVCPDDLGLSSETIARSDGLSCKRAEVADDDLRSSWHMKVKRNTTTNGFLGSTSCTNEGRHKSGSGPERVDYVTVQSRAPVGGRSEHHHTHSHQLFIHNLDDKARVHERRTRGIHRSSQGII